MTCGFIVCLQAYKAGTQARPTDYVSKHTCVTMWLLVLLVVLMAAEVPSVLCAEAMWNVCCRTKEASPAACLVQRGATGSRRVLGRLWKAGGWWP